MEIHGAGVITLDSFKLMEHYIYDSARVGMALSDVNLYPAISPNPHASDSMHYVIYEGWKRYEITNHLGNVLTVITDRKRGKGSGSAIQWFVADVMASQQYYPFGMLMPGSTDSTLRRQYSLNSYDYRYGFNGKEGDDEVKGDDNQQDYGRRVYDPRVGRFLSVDPIAKEFPWYTPYQFSGNKPIMAIDLDGLEEYYAADGSYLGKSGKSTEIRIIAEQDVIPIAKENLSHLNYDHTWLIDHSAQAFKYDKEKELNLLNDWAMTYQRLTYEREYTMSLFKKTLTKNGKNFEAIIQGSTGEGPKKFDSGGAEVSFKTSTIKINGVDIEEKYKWIRSTAIHTHTGINSSFSNEKGDWGHRSGDIPVAIYMNVKVVLITRGSKWAYLFDPEIYKQKNPDGLETV